MISAPAGDLIRCLTMTNRWGTPLSTFQNRNDFYAAYPHLLTGWGNLKDHPGRAPLGLDVLNDRDSLVILCAPLQQAGARPSSGVTGVAIEFDHKTGEIHVLEQNITFADAENRFKP